MPMYVPCKKVPFRVEEVSRVDAPFERPLRVIGEDATGALAEYLLVGNGWFVSAIGEKHEDSVWYTDHIALSKAKSLRDHWSKEFKREKNKHWKPIASEKFARLHWFKIDNASRASL